MRIEKRETPRTLIKIQINYGGAGAYLFDYSRDMSETGIFIATDQPLVIGANITLKFILPEVLEEIEAEGVVTWINPAGSIDPPQGMGVKFLKLSPEKQKLILDVIEKIEEGRSASSIE